MNVKARESDAPLIVYVDVKSPYAFIAIRPTLALEARLGLEFDWRPLTLDIPSYLGSARKTDSGKVVENNRTPKQWGAVKYAYRDARRYADRQGYRLYGTQKIWDSSIANMAITWVVERDRARLGDYLDQVYPPFWRRELDIEDARVVADLIRAAGIDADGFVDYQAGDGRAAHDALQAQLHDSGIFGVPTYVFGEAFEEALFGREHLPYVEWHLTGRAGTPPDIAYPI